MVRGILESCRVRNVYMKTNPASFVCRRRNWKRCVAHAKQQKGCQTCTRVNISEPGIACTVLSSYPTLIVRWGKKIHHLRKSSSREAVDGTRTNFVVKVTVAISSRYPDAMFTRRLVSLCLATKALRKYGSHNPCPLFACVRVARFQPQEDEAIGCPSGGT